MKNIFGTILLFMGLMVISPAFVYAGGTVYVDEDAGSGGDGSKDDPYNDIKDAIGEGDKIVVAKGTYNESFTLGKGVELKGAGRGKTTIVGTVTMKDGTEIEDVTVKTGGIVVGSGDDAKITDVSVKGANIGITTDGNGKLTVRDSKINDNRKGMYLKKGKNVDIRNSEVANNDEEGIDIRSNVDGVISGNAIYSNGESGIEVVLGSSQLIVSGNNIKNNKSSGIATQFYKSAKKLGGLQVLNNKLNGNKSYGLDCKTPSGGNPGPNYWTESVTFSGNAVTGNKQGSFASKCKFGQQKEAFALLTEEEKAAKIAADKKAEEERLARLTEAEKKAEEEARKAEEERRLAAEREQKKKEIAQGLSTIRESFGQSQEAVSAPKTALSEQSGFSVFFTGIDAENLATLEQENQAHRERLTQLEQMYGQTSDNGQKAEIAAVITEVSETLTQQEALVVQEHSRPTFKKWFCFWCEA